MTVNRRLAPPPDTSAEMLELIAKVTASISDRIDAQDKTLEDIRRIGQDANVQILDYLPRVIESMQVEEREQVEAEYHRDRRKWRAWRWGVFTSGPVIVLLLALILPTLFARHPLTCETMAGTWHIENGQAYCFFRRDAP